MKKPSKNTEFELAWQPQYMPSSNVGGPGLLSQAHATQ
jgi:hypothetical protein